MDANSKKELTRQILYFVGDSDEDNREFLLDTLEKLGKEHAKYFIEKIERNQCDEIKGIEQDVKKLYFFFF